jgi:uncharacterized protein (TIGR02646 family)
MIHIDRLPKPDILIEKEIEWTENFINSGEKRPHNSKYGHQQIRTRLYSMSSNKCFYCERKLTGVSKEIDHFIEVSDPIGKSLAFNWDNLFLACNNCNDKLYNKDISVMQVLNPCFNTDEEIETHITFEDEFITSKNNSQKGLLTIKKFRLDTELLDLLRSKHLIQFYKLLVQIERNKNAENRISMNDLEKESLHIFKQKDHQFSLMFKIILEKNGIN